MRGNRSQTLSEEQTRYLKQLAKQQDWLTKNQLRVDSAKVHLDYMINEAMEMKISAPKIANAVGLSPARIHQIRKGFRGTQ